MGKNTKLNIYFSGDDKYAISIEDGEQQRYGACIYVDFDTLKEMRARIDHIIKREAEIQVENLEKK